MKGDRDKHTTSRRHASCQHTHSRDSSTNLRPKKSTENERLLFRNRVTVTHAPSRTTSTKSASPRAASKTIWTSLTEGNTLGRVTTQPL